MPRCRVILIPFLAALTSCATTPLPIPESWLSTPAIKRVGPIELAADGSIRNAPAVPAQASEVRIEKKGDGQVLARGSESLTPPFPAIQSFDVSMERREIAFSAKRKDNFDVALVSLDGSRVNWVPDDPADETDPRWARRGNKFSYVLRTPGGDLVRTIHVPTSYYLTIEFPNSVVNDVTWDAAAERFAVSYESPDASERVDVMKYGGEERKESVPPAAKLDYAMQPFGTGSILMVPAQLRYQEKLPVIVWMTEDRLNRWDDARAALLQQVRAACVVTTTAPDAAFWDRLRQVQWADSQRIFVVSPGSVPPSLPKGTLLITGNASTPAGRYRRDGQSVLVPPSDVKSFAVGFVAQQLKGTSPIGN